MDASGAADLGDGPGESDPGTPPTSGSTPAAPAREDPRPKLWPVLLLYTVLRIGMIAVLTLLLSLLFIPLVALAFAVALQLPLAWLVLAPIRRRVNEAMAVATENRRAERERLQRALSGEA